MPKIHTIKLTTFSSLDYRVQSESALVTVCISGLQRLFPNAPRVGGPLPSRLTLRLSRAPFKGSREIYCDSSTYTAGRKRELIDFNTFAQQRLLSKLFGCREVFFTGRFYAALTRED